MTEQGSATSSQGASAWIDNSSKQPATPASAAPPGVAGPAHLGNVAVPHGVVDATPQSMAQRGLSSAAGAVKSGESAAAASAGAAKATGASQTRGDAGQSR